MKNISLALKYFEKGCQYDDAPSCLLAGVQLTADDSKQRNILKGLSYLDKGCNNGNAESCYFASGMYIKGKFTIFIINVLANVGEFGRFAKTQDVELALRTISSSLFTN